MSQTETGPYVSKGLERVTLKDPAVKAALSRVPRHRFVPEPEKSAAYEDRALPIGEGQTISQPYIVALMTEQAGITKGSKVLEIGTGSGYQAAVLAELGARVFSIELNPDLAKKAELLLAELGYSDRIKLRNGDGWEGWQEAGPFDAILVTAASPKVPPRLIEQLANRGKLVLPIEKYQAAGERLLVFEKKDESIISRDLGAVRFVPLLGAARELENELSGSETETALGIGEAASGVKNASPLRPNEKKSTHK